MRWIQIIRKYYFVTDDLLYYTTSVSTNEFLHSTSDYSNRLGLETTDFFPLLVTRFSRHRDPTLFPLAQ